ncbi:hypothetical protein PsorP6_006097 [Peronosclerospora sorghi]|uniref:Uncharacterized protein n=1 Tax=Peronosclerospora sorghi TaxID=230839 RepID=A0ACC0W3E0_9STRA|nr:hypothetical protein PsorP6_006097 [Peronosclerospora sorghi]
MAESDARSDGGEGGVNEMTGAAGMLREKAARSKGNVEIVALEAQDGGERCQEWKRRGRRVLDDAAGATATMEN